MYKQTQLDRNRLHVLPSTAKPFQSHAHFFIIWNMPTFPSHVPGCKTSSNMKPQQKKKKSMKLIRSIPPFHAATPYSTCPRGPVRLTGPTPSPPPSCIASHHHQRHKPPPARLDMISEDAHQASRKTKPRTSCLSIQTLKALGVEERRVAPNDPEGLPFGSDGGTFW